MQYAGQASTTRHSDRRADGKERIKLNIKFSLENILLPPKEKHHQGSCAMTPGPNQAVLNDGRIHFPFFRSEIAFDSVRYRLPACSAIEDLMR